MRFCNQIGIAHDRFLEEWSEEARAKALAYELYKAQICEMCGTAPWEWDESQGGTRFAYEPVEEICPGCEKKDWLRDDGDKKRPAGGFITLRRREGQ
jgi:hypothetical protein